MIIFEQKYLSHSIILNEKIKNLAWLVKNTFNTINNVSICNEDDIFNYAPYVPLSGENPNTYCYGTKQFVANVQNTLANLYGIASQITDSTNDGEFLLLIHSNTVIDKYRGLPRKASPSYKAFILNNYQKMITQ